MIPTELWSEILRYASYEEIVQPLNYHVDPRRNVWLEQEPFHKRFVQNTLNIMSVSKMFHDVSVKNLPLWIIIQSVVDPAHRMRRILNLLKSSPRMYTQNASPMARGLATRRIDIDTMMFGAEGDQQLAELLSLCPSTTVYTEGIQYNGDLAVRISAIKLKAITQLTNLRRLEFTANHGPSAEDILTILSSCTSLEYFSVGMVPGPRFEPQAQAVLHLPSLTHLRFSYTPIHSPLSVLNVAQLPNLTHFTNKHLDFNSPRFRRFFEVRGRQLLYVATNGIRTAEAPYVTERLFSYCPRLRFLSFAPQINDERLANPEAWTHNTLECLWLHSLLPRTLPPDPNLRVNIANAITRILHHVSTGNLPSLRVIRLCDALAVVAEASQWLMTTHGPHWAAMVSKLGAQLEDGHGHIIAPHGVAREAYEASDIVID